MEEAAALLELQDLDLKILRLNKRLDEMPEKRDILAMRAKLAEVRALLDRARAAGQAVDASLKRLDDAAAAVTAKMEAEQAKLLSGTVKNPKELQAISLELDGLKRRRDALETDELAEMSKRETASEQEAKIRGVLEAGQRKEASLIEIFKQRGGSLVSEIEQVTAQRVKVAESLSPAIAERYESLRTAKHGIAVGTLDGNTCGACRVSLPEGELERLHEGPSIAECPKCRRMLIVSEGE